MINQRMLEIMYETFLSHHGVDGQQWGVQNGPPYPLSGENKRIAKQQYKEYKKYKKEEQHARKVEKRKNKIIGEADIEAARKHPSWFSQQEMDAIIKKRATLKAMEAASGTNQSASKSSKENGSKLSSSKKKALEKGDLDYIRKHPKDFSTEEMEYAKKRRNVIDSQYTKPEKEIKKEQKLATTEDKIKKIAAVAGSIGTIIGLAKTGMDVVSTYKKFKLSDTDYADKRFKSQFDNLKGIDKNLALEAFNKYWNTNYQISDIQKSDQSKKNNNANNDKKNNNTNNDKKNDTNQKNGKKVANDILDVLGTIDVSKDYDKFINLSNKEGKRFVSSYEFLEIGKGTPLDMIFIN